MSARVEELHGYFIDDLAIGMSAVYAKTVTEADITLFAGVSGDDNPIHLNRDFAASSRFEERVAHGMLTASLISAVIGTRLPGPGAIYRSQTLKFVAPVRIGDTVDARAEVVEIDREKQRVRLSTVCSVGDTVVIEGEAEIWVPARV